MSEKIVVSIDPDLEDLIPGFLNNRAKDVASINELIEQGDFDAIRILGHSMKGAGGGYGFDPITDIGGKIESASVERDAAAIVQANAELAEYLDRVEPVYDESD